MTGVPEQMLVALAAIETLGVNELLTVMLTGVETAETGEAQETDEVMTQVTASPLASEALV